MAVQLPPWLPRAAAPAGVCEHGRSKGGPIPSRYDHIDLTATQGMQKEAAIALDLRRKLRRGGTRKGYEMARRIVSGQRIHPDNVRDMSLILPLSGASGRATRDPQVGLSERRGQQFADRVEVVGRRPGPRVEPRPTSATRRRGSRGRSQEPHPVDRPSGGRARYLLAAMARPCPGADRAAHTRAVAARAAWHVP